jgi:hypothetical protein
MRTKMDVNDAAKLVIRSITTMIDRDHPVYYVSVPITGVSIDRQKKYAATIAGYRDELVNVINPQEMQIDGFSNEQYLKMWKHVIESLVDVMIMSDGWQKSNGCVYEARLANKLGLKTFDYKLQRTKLEIK